MPIRPSPAAFLRIVVLTGIVAGLADLENTDLGQVASWIANTGISFRLTPQLRLAIDARYTQYKPDSPTAVIQDGRAIHPLLVGAGMRLRF